jgi:hypothetical protein
MHLNLKKAAVSMIKIPVVLPVLLASTSFNPSIALAEMTSEQLYQLCSSFPHNSQCKGYTAPVALKNRPGQESQCTWGAGDDQKRGDCKFAFYPEGVLVYVETGDTLKVLGDRRASQEIKVSYEQIKALDYREFTQNNEGKRTAYALLFGTGWAGLVKDKFLAEVTMQYQPAPAESVSDATIIQPLSLVLERDLGSSVRSHLESKTNLRVEVPEGELPFVELPTP